MRPRIPQGVTRHSHIVSGGGRRAAPPLPISVRAGAAPGTAAHRALCPRALARAGATPRCACAVTKKEIRGMACSLLKRVLAMKRQPQPNMKLSDRHSSAALLALTTAVLVLVLAGLLFAAEVDTPGPLAAVPGAPTALTGWFHTQFGDSPNGGGDHMHAHVLVDDNGHATRLSVPDAVIAAAGGRAAIDHHRV